MMALMNLIIDALGIRIAMESDIRKRLKLFLITLSIGLVVVVFDPF